MLIDHKTTNTYVDMVYQQYPKQQNEMLIISSTGSVVWLI